MHGTLFHAGEKVMKKSSKTKGVPYCSLTEKLDSLRMSKKSSTIPIKPIWHLQILPKLETTSKIKELNISYLMAYILTILFLFKKLCKVGN